jgi:protoporphyrin/coproporphyrin ferrochelatase
LLLSIKSYSLSLGNDSNTMTQNKTGVLLVNLGTPTEPTPRAVRKFLKDFLSDARVVDLPRLLWLPILYCIILVFRPKRVAKNYKKIWFEQGSPLMVYSRLQQQKLQTLFDYNDQSAIKVELAMTYGDPSINDSCQALERWGAEQIIVLPLYPQFSHTTTSSVIDQLEVFKQQSQIPVNVIQDYHDAPSYIEALADSIKTKFDLSESSSKKLVFSYHGIPKRYVENGDPYQTQCIRTTELVVEKLGLLEHQWELAYQSRVGKEEWLKPYLDQRMEALAGENTKSIAVVAPAFSVDCLETLEEIAMENKALFIENGGEQFEYIAALNDSPLHIKMMKTLISQRIQAVS